MNPAVIVFALAATLAGWVLVGYPLWLAWRARRSGRPVRRGPVDLTVSVVIPVRNGAAFLAAKLDSVLGQDYPRTRVIEIFVLSDGSTDATAEIAAGYADRGVRLFTLPSGGKCAALNHAWQHATGDLLLLTDVRQQLDPACLSRLAACFADPAVGAASGELRIRAGATAGEARVGLYWRFESWMRSALSQVDSMLGATGPIYALRRELAVPVPVECLLDDMYLPLAAFRRGYRLVQEPAAIAWDYPTSLDSEFRRKVRTLAGNYQLLGYYPWLLGPANRMWLDYVSIKLGRLALPFLLLAIAGASPWLPMPWSMVALAGQGAFYLLAAVDPWWPERAPGKGISSAARAFVVMMAAAVLALRVFFVEPTSLWTHTHVRKN